MNLIFKCKYIFYFFFIISIFTFSCGKDDNYDSSIIPSIYLVADSNCIIGDTNIPEGSPIKIHIRTSANGGENLTNLIVTSNDSLRLVDLGFNSNVYDYILTIYKNSSDTEHIKLTIRNKIGKSKTISFHLFKNGSAYGQIRILKNIVIGAQSNNFDGLFYSIDSNKSFLMSEAFNNQNLIDLVYYYIAADGHVIASPGANIAGIYSGSSSPDNWTIKNTSYFGKLPFILSQSVFDSANNDSLILANKFTTSGRKAKPVSNGQIWSFQNAAGKYGLLKITEISGLEAGYIKLDIQIQK